MLLSWLALSAVIGVLLAIDLRASGRRGHALTAGEAAGWSAVWIGAALCFNAGVWAVWYGPKAALEFLSAWLVEKSLSVDNLFVFLAVFSAFGIERERQPIVLKWGIIGAAVTRLAFIAVGAALVHRFHWILYVFGAILIWTAWRIVSGHGAELEPKESWGLKALKGLLPLKLDQKGSPFFVRAGGKLYGTSMLAALVVLEAADVLFAVDSIPAVFGISSDTFIVFSSNLFAVLGLRSLYFLLSAAMDRMVYLPYGVAGVLAFIGAKLLADWHIGAAGSLGVIAVVLGATAAVSFLRPPPERRT